MANGIGLWHLLWSLLSELNRLMPKWHCQYTTNCARYRLCGPYIINVRGVRWEVRYNRHPICFSRAYTMSMPFRVQPLQTHADKRTLLSQNRIEYFAAVLLFEYLNLYFSGKKVSLLQRRLLSSLRLFSILILSKQREFETQCEVRIISKF